MKMNATKTVFVTVGTTKFNKLIETITTDEVLTALNDRGYTRLIMQIGNTNLHVDSAPRCGFTEIETFTLKPTIKDYINFADLVISHAGAGSCLEVLEARKPLVVVTNADLMDNHQSELAEQLFKDNYLYQCTCDNLCEIIKTMDLLKLKKFICNKSVKIALAIDEMMGFTR